MREATLNWCLHHMISVDFIKKKIGRLTAEEKDPWFERDILRAK